jgi:hypothetical protein
MFAIFSSVSFQCLLERESRKKEEGKERGEEGERERGGKRGKGRGREGE